MEIDDKIIDFYEGKLSLGQRLELFRLLENNPGLQKEFITMNNTLGLVELCDRPEDRIAGKRAFAEFRRRKTLSVRRRRLRRVAGYAAVLLLAVAGSSLFYDRTDGNPLTAPIVMSMPAGQRGQLTLSDGTTVWLNARSSLTFPPQFNGAERRVRLQGEGYFEVVKNEKKPFIVETDAIDVKVLGTVFNVDSYRGHLSTEVSLVEGSVEVTAKNEQHPHVTLCPGQNVTFRDERLYLSSFDNADEFLWRKGIYSFERATLEEILRKLELYYDTTIIIGTDSLRGLVYTGKFRQRDGVADILNVISKVYHFEVQRDIENNTITLK